MTEELEKSGKETARFDFQLFSESTLASSSHGLCGGTWLHKMAGNRAYQNTGKVQCLLCAKFVATLL